MKKQRELKADYKREPRPMGVYAVRDLKVHVAYVGTAKDLPGILNRHRFELKVGGHQNKDLVAAFRQHGVDAFAFEVLDKLEPKTEPGQDYEDDLAMLLQLRMEQGLTEEDGTPVSLVLMY
jgi:hypothetical protein